MRNFSLKKKESYRRSSKRSVLRIGALTLIIVVLILLFRGVFGGPLSFVTLPLYSVRTWVSDIGIVAPFFLRDRAALADKFTALEEELAALRDRGDRVRELEAENEELRNLLGEGEDETRIAAGIIARPPFLPYDALLIDRGFQDGVREGAVVYHFEDQVIGIVQKAYSESALVTLLSTPGTQTTAYVIGPDIYTTVYGMGDGILRVSVPQDIPLAVGDAVVLPSLERGVLGTIATIESGQTDPEQNGFITMSAGVQSFRFVSVGTREIEKVSFEEAQQHIESQKEFLFTIDVPEEFLTDTDSGTSTATTTESIEENVEEETPDLELEADPTEE